ncbi:peptidase inhibitor family I36 protein (plasmid) [Streptomyces sp. NBC_00015]|uniref:peptidase inhibitor family I36 protein n=1 Tax=unclassified Streptomyces TaxID=2593676 RepID=UPI002F9106E9
MTRAFKLISAVAVSSACLFLSACGSGEGSDDVKSSASAATGSTGITTKDGSTTPLEPIDTIVICTDSTLFGECSVAPTIIEDLAAYKGGIFNDSISSIINSQAQFQICFYRDPNFRGPSFAVGPGVEVDDVNDFDPRLVAENFNDKVSSFRIFQNRPCIEQAQP